jgi:hypothetical protein
MTVETTRSVARNIEKKDVVSLRSSKDWRRGKELF